MRSLIWMSLATNSSLPCERIRRTRRFCGAHSDRDFKTRCLPYAPDLATESVDDKKHCCHVGIAVAGALDEIEDGTRQAGRDTHEEQEFDG